MHDFSSIVNDSSLIIIVPYLNVYENINLNNSLTNHSLRDSMLKCYQNNTIPAFETYLFTDENDFQGLRWVQKSGLKLKSCNLIINESTNRSVTNPDEILWHLVNRKFCDLATFYLKRSSARDYTNQGILWGGPLTSTFFIAASRRYTEIVQGLINKGFDINDDKNGEGTPLLIACHYGCIEVVRVLLDLGVDINKAGKSGITPLQAATSKVREVLEFASQCT